jgi:hypothetical protein
MSEPTSDELRARISRVTNQRVRRLLELIVEHGAVTTEELTARYGYNHPPRAKKDALDLGFPVVSRRVRSKDGSRSISEYSLDREAAFADDRSGRKPIAKALRTELLGIAEGRCAICGGTFAGRALQVDHRIPYEIGRESDSPSVSEFQMLCGSCNRAKSWTCERECANWEERDASVCSTCLWAAPDSYRHIATKERRQVTLTWEEGAVAIFERLKASARAEGLEMANYLHRLIGDK